MADEAPEGVRPSWKNPLVILATVIVAAIAMAPFETRLDYIRDFERKASDGWETPRAAL